MGTYIFPDVLGNLMSKVDTKTQMEASMLSMTLMMIGLIITAFYVGIYVEFPLWYKIVLEINFLCGLVFMSSFLIQSFQAYKNILEVMEFQKND